MTPKRTESAAERDERIVAEAGTWAHYDFHLWPKRDLPGDDDRYLEMLKAAARVLNRIVRRRGKKEKQ